MLALLGKDALLLGFLLGGADFGVGGLGQLGMPFLVPFAKADEVLLQPLDRIAERPLLRLAGSAIPLKFSLGGYQGMGIMAAGYPKSAPMGCSSSEDPLTETFTAGQSSLQYDATAGQYIYVWKSEKSWAGTCRQIQVKLIDGTTHTANFSFK